MDFLLVTRPALGLIALASAVALSAAFIGQYIFDLPPCDLCIYQRYPYVIAIALCLITLMPAIQSYAFWTFITLALFLLINSGIAVASKDLSLVRLYNLALLDNELCFTAFQKKSEYGPLWGGR